MYFLIKFQNDYKVGIAVIDAQHESFFDILNKLESALMKKDLNSLNNNLNDLIKYTKYHFITEEVFLSELDTEIHEKHKALHYIIETDILKYKERVAVSDNPILVFTELFDTSKIYLIDHIINEDNIIKKINTVYF